MICSYCKQEIEVDKPFKTLFLGTEKSRTCCQKCFDSGKGEFTTEKGKRVNFSQMYKRMTQKSLFLKVSG